MAVWNEESEDQLMLLTQAVVWMYSCILRGMFKLNILASSNNTVLVSVWCVSALKHHRFCKNRHSMCHTHCPAFIDCTSKCHWQRGPLVWTLALQLAYCNFTPLSLMYWGMLPHVISKDLKCSLTLTVFYVIFGDTVDFIRSSAWYFKSPLFFEMCNAERTQSCDSVI